MSTVKVNTIDKRTGSTLTLGGSGTAVTLACGATQTGFGRTGTVDWQTGSIKTSTFTAANGEGYFANTSGGAFTMNLPAGSAGAIVSVSDYTRTFQTNNLTISPNGSEKIGGVAAPATLSTQGQTATFVYVDATEGWINTQETSNSVTGATFMCSSGGNATLTCGNFKTHVFTSSGTFTVNSLGNNPANNTVEYLVVAGGAGGGDGSGTGGGGAGGFRTTYPSPVSGGLAVTATGFPITVGAGGAFAPAPSGRGVSGGVSTFSSITSAGGGGGGSEGGGNQPPASPTDVQTGGAGGGGTGAKWPATAGTTGTVNTGGGGGGGISSPTQPNGSGGSGFVAIRYRFQ